MPNPKISKINVGGTEYDIDGGGGTGSGVFVGTTDEIEDAIENEELLPGDAYLATDDLVGGLSNPIYFATYAAYLAAYNNGDIPVGAVIAIGEGNNNDITALQVSYGQGNVKSTLDQINEDLTDKLDISAYKVFIDPSNLILSQGASSVNYTADVDCYIIFASNSSNSLLLDGNTIFTGSGNYGWSFNCYIKAGTTVSGYASVGFRVYGLK